MSSLVRDRSASRLRKNEDRRSLLPALAQDSKDKEEPGHQNQVLGSTRRTKPSPIDTVQNSRASPNAAAADAQTPSPLARMARTAANMACNSPLGKLLQTAANFVQKSPLGRAANSFCHAALDPSTPLGSVVRSPVSLATRLAERSAEVAMRSPVARKALSRFGGFRESPSIPNLTSGKLEEETPSGRGSRTRRSPSIPSQTSSKSEEVTTMAMMSRTRRSPSIPNLPPVEESSANRMAGTKRSPSIPNLANRQEEAEKKHYARLGMTMSSNRQEKALLRQGLGSANLCGSAADAAE